MPKRVNKKTVKKTATKKAVKKKKAVRRGGAKATSSKTGSRKIAKHTKHGTKAVKRHQAKSKTTSVKASAKKKTSRKRAKATPTVLTKKELEYFRVLLIEKLKEIIGSVNHIETEALKASRLDSTGDLSSMPIHMADIGSDNYEQEFVLDLMDSERKIVSEILQALKRIQNKTYGICEGTGEPIPKERLKGIPWTRYCVRYAEMLEKGLVTETEGPYTEDSEYTEEDTDGEYFDDDYEDEMDEEDEDDRDIFFYGYDDEEDEEEEDEL